MDILKKFADVDLKKQWVDVPQDKNDLSIKKKDIWGRFQAFIIQIFTGGRQGHKRDGIVRVATAIQLEVSEKIASGKLDSEAVNSTIKSLKKLDALSAKNAKIRHSLTGILGSLQGSISAFSASSFYNQKQDMDAVLSKYKELDKTSPEMARSFIKTPDSQGKTFLHHLVEMSDGLQFTTIKTLENELGAAFMQDCFLIQDNSGKTPLDVAMERGQMAVIGRAFPIPVKENAFQLSKEDLSHLKQTAAALLKCLSQPKERRKLLEKCPGEYEFDKLNHIMNALHAIDCANPGLVRGEISKSTSGLQDILHEFLLDAKLSREDASSLYQNLCRAAEECKTPQEVSQLMTEWRLIGPLLKEPAAFVLANSVIKSQGENALSYLISMALNPSEEKVQKGNFNCLAEILNPFAPYDQKVDFSNPAYVNTPEGEPLLQKVLEDVIKKNYDLDQSKEVITLLVTKVPALLYAKGVKGDAFTLLSKQSNHKASELLKFLQDLEKELPKSLFENRVKKALKFNLEQKGNALS